MYTTPSTLRRHFRKASLYTPLFLLALALGLSPTEKQAYGQDDEGQFAHSKIEFTAYAALDEAFRAAREHYEGRLLVYFYNSTSSVSKATERVVFSDDSLSALVNRSFARYAIDAHSDEAKQLLEDHSFTSGRNAPLKAGDPLLLFMLIDRGYETAFSMKSRLKESYPPEELARVKAWIFVWRDVGVMLNALPYMEFSQWMSETFRKYQAAFH